MLECRIVRTVFRRRKLVIHAQGGAAEWRHPRACLPVIHHIHIIFRFSDGIRCLYRGRWYCPRHIALKLNMIDNSMIHAQGGPAEWSHPWACLHAIQVLQRDSCEYMVHTQIPFTRYVVDAHVIFINQMAILTSHSWNTRYIRKSNSLNTWQYSNLLKQIIWIIYNGEARLLA